MHRLGSNKRRWTMQVEEQENPKKEYEPLRVVLVEDHPVMLEGLRWLVAREPDLEVCGEAEDADNALALIHATQPDVAVVDLLLKASSGFSVLQEAAKVSPKTRLLVYSMYEESMYAERVVRAGAHGYMTKKMASQKIAEGIRAVASGNLYVSDEMTATWLRKMVGTGNTFPLSPVERLSDRELQVFQLIGEGIAHKDIAVRLNVSLATVESHVERIKEKNNLRSGRELLKQAVEWAVRSRG